MIGHSNLFPPGLSLSRSVIRELQDAVKLPALFEKILEYAHKHRKCLGCDRGIADGDEATRVTAYATSKRDRFRQRFDQTDTLKRELADWEQTKARFLQLQPSVEKVARLRQDEIPGLRDRAEAKQATLEVAKTEAEKVSWFCWVCKTTQDGQR